MRTGCHHPYANRSYQLIPKAIATRRPNLVTLTRPNSKKLSQPKKVNVGPIPKATQRNWLTTLKAKEVEATASSQAHAPTQPTVAPADQSPNSPLSPYTKYCAVCTPLGKLCPNEFPVCQDWGEDSKEEGNDKNKGEDNFSVCSDWDRKNQKIKDQKDNKGKTPKNSPTFLSATSFTLQPPESSIKQSTRKSSETPTEEENKCWP